MKAIISSTFDPMYQYFIPIVVFTWNKLGVDVICFLPSLDILDSPNYFLKADSKMKLITQVMKEQNLKGEWELYKASADKEATYAQCARLYAACLDLPEDEILIIGDVDMALFKIPTYIEGITIFGSDLVPKEQFPMCYASGTVKDWRSAMKLNGKTYQQCLDNLLGEIECEHMRGNYWGKDQQTLWENTNDIAALIPRARLGTQFASNRVDRDDINWRSYVNDELVDAHLWRPGFKNGNFENILELLTIKFPNEDFTWLINYTERYKQFL